MVACVASDISKRCLIFFSKLVALSLGKTTTCLVALIFLSLMHLMRFAPGFTNIVNTVMMLSEVEQIRSDSQAFVFRVRVSCLPKCFSPERDTRDFKSHHSHLHLIGAEGLLTAKGHCSLRILRAFLRILRALQAVPGRQPTRAYHCTLGVSFSEETRS